MKAGEDKAPEDATPSVKAILGLLEGHAPMTGKQLREQSGLPRRTVYTALRRLRDMGLLKERPSLRDSRQTYFWIAGDQPEPGQGLHPAPPAGPAKADPFNRPHHH